MKPLNLRFIKSSPKLDNSLKKDIETLSLKICTASDTDFNSIEFAIRKGIPYVIDFFNPAAIAEKTILHDNNFNWLAQTTSDYLIDLANKESINLENYSWKKFLNGEIVKTKISQKKPTRKKKSV